MVYMVYLSGSSYILGELDKVRCAVNNQVSSILTEAEQHNMHPDALAVFLHYQFERLPVEGTFYKNTYRSKDETPSGAPGSTAMLGLYCNQPLSVSCFHRLPYAEIWHVYAGDPFELILLYPDGRDESVLMGNNPLKGEKVQFVVPAHTWQAGSLLPGGRYALYGCTMAPGFYGADFEAGIAEELASLYPQRAEDIRRLSVNGHQTHMPEGF
jgi:predicted cupin superfamily sugar epimerase